MLDCDEADWFIHSGSIVHIVMFKYPAGLSPATKSSVSAAFVGLKESCRLPNGSRYIQSVDGGLNNSPEGHTKGLEVCPSLP